MARRQMNPIATLLLSFSFFASATPPQVPGGADVHSDGHECEQYLIRDLDNTYIVPSGAHDLDVMPKYQEMVNDIFGPNGAAARLGVAVPKHQVEFVSNSEMSILNAAGAHHPIGHWIDGSQIAASRGTSVLEFVWGGVPGCSTCRAYYSDSLKPDQNLYILLHVAGHNDFSEHSMYWDMRATDMMAASLRLAEMVEKFSHEHDADEVSKWYQYLNSFINAQDYARGTYDPPATLTPETADFKNGGKHPKRPTSSLLQAIVANLPATAPKWKRDMALLFEEVKRSYAYVVSQKGMNEGWATLMMQLIWKYLPEKYHTDTYKFEGANLLSGVVGFSGKSLSNPYWLGREAWLRLRERYHARPDIAALPTELERDQKFVAWAHKQIRQMNDYDFYRMALDEPWVKRNKLYLYRKAGWDEQDPAMGRPPKEGYEQKIVTTTETKRVVTAIARQTSDRTLQFARIFAQDLHAFGRNVFALKHEVYDNTPLKWRSAVETLFVLSRIEERSVSLDTIGSSTWLPKKPRDQWLDRGSIGGWGGGRPWWQPPPEPIETFPLRIEIEPNGRVQAFTKEANSGGEQIETLNTHLTEKFQAAVDVYKEDIDYDMSPAMAKIVSEKFMPAMINQIVNGATQPSMGLLNHTPTAARALLEYANMIERRMAASLQRLLNQLKKGTVSISGSKVRLRVLPSIPSFELDQGLRRRMIKLRGEEQPAPVDVTTMPSAPLLSLSLANVQDVAPAVDDDSNISKGDVQPGDHIWGPGENDGDGQGEEGEEQEGDPDPNKDPNHGPGPGLDPSEVEIDLQTLGEMLWNEFELPNMRRTRGLTTKVDHIREGGVHRPSGNILWERMMPQVLALGQQAIDEQKKQGKLKRRPLMNDVLREGFKRIQPSDYVVSTTEPTPVPDRKAVLVRVLDLTGSMSGEPAKREKQFFKLIEALLRAKYKEVEIRSVGYDDKAYEFPGDKIFTTFLGGGNTDSEGYKLAEKILDEYDHAEWNMYVIGTGDSGSSDGPAVVESMARLYERCQYMGYGQVSVYGQGPGASWGMLADIEKFAADKEWFGMTTLTDEASILPAIQEFFTPKEDK